MSEAGGSGLVNTTRTPLMSLAATLQDRRILTVIIGWTVLNVLLAEGVPGLTEAAALPGEASRPHAALLYGFRLSTAPDDNAGVNRSLRILLKSTLLPSEKAARQPAGEIQRDRRATWPVL
jgi:hypothetical protein